MYFNVENTIKRIIGDYHEIISCQLCMDVRMGMLLHVAADRKLCLDIKLRRIYRTFDVLS